MTQLAGMMGVTIAEGFKTTDHITGDVAPYRFGAVTRSSRAGQGSVRCTA